MFSADKNTEIVIETCQKGKFGRYLLSDRIARLTSYGRIVISSK